MFVVPTTRWAACFISAECWTRSVAIAKENCLSNIEVNLGKGFDEKCATFLRVRYELVVEYVNQGLNEEAILESCFGMGRRPSQGEIYMWNEFMRKRGWNDELSEALESQKKKEAMLSRSEIQTMFQFIDADEGRLVNDKHISGYWRSKYGRTGNGVPAKE